MRIFRITHFVNSFLKASSVSTFSSLVNPIAKLSEHDRAFAMVLPNFRPETLSYIAAWRYNTKQEQQLIDLYWNIRTSASRWFYYKTLLWNFKYCREQIENVCHWLTSKQSMSSHVSLCQYMSFLLAFP